MMLKIDFIAGVTIEYVAAFDVSRLLMSCRPGHSSLMIAIVSSFESYWCKESIIHKRQEIFLVLSLSVCL